MSFSYTLFLALLLLAPGLAVWAGFRFGEKPGLISQAPERPGSTISLLVIVFGSLIGHCAMAGMFAAQSLWCRSTGACLTVDFDPNVYRIIISARQSAALPADFAVFAWFLGLLLPAIALGLASFAASRWTWVRHLREQATFGWLKPWIDRARPEDSFITAYVVTALEHEGSNVAYEGTVESLALDDQRTIVMIVLRDCDRFLVRVTEGEVRRLDVDQRAIPLIQLAGDTLVNVALEVFDDVPEPEQEPG